MPNPLPSQLPLVDPAPWTAQPPATQPADPALGHVNQASRLAEQAPRPIEVEDLVHEVEPVPWRIEPVLPTTDHPQRHIDDLLRQVERALRPLGRAIVAYSGGVDSTLLAKLARDVLGKPNALAVTADSPSIARADLDDARRFARQLDLEQLVVATNELHDRVYRANTGSRCYVCKGTLFEVVDRLAAERGVRAVLYGAIGDDVAAERPGQRAAAEHRVLAPLQDAGMTKAEVREAARQLGLPNWDRPQNACLSSRIPHGHEVTEQRLRQIERAEALLLALGFRHVRVRHLGGHARIEVEPTAVSRFDDPELRAQIVGQLLTVGFESVGLDRAGYRAGGADRAAEEWILTSA